MEPCFLKRLPRFHARSGHWLISKARDLEVSFGVLAGLALGDEERLRIRGSTEIERSPSTGAVDHERCVRRC
jgi:hypothetical protein